tara:strand:- start:320 stop:463 length:144 start_codon:yes stop_codon:yes gene_type:complete
MFRELFPVTNEDSFTFVSEEWIDPHRTGTMQALVLNGFERISSGCFI